MQNLYSLYKMSILSKKKLEVWLHSTQIEYLKYQQIDLVNQIVLLTQKYFYKEHSLAQI